MIIKKNLRVDFIKTWEKNYLLAYAQVDYS